MFLARSTYLFDWHEKEERERKKVGGAKGGFERRKTPSGHLCVYNNKGGTGGVCERLRRGVYPHLL
jgi:hypothetical protein